ncbi:MAG: sigma-70 family RNA polymerase sigma factor [Acidobacteriota bacterium]
MLEETEKELVDRCQSACDGRSDSDAFRALFERYKDRVYSIALRYSGDPAVAQDIAQETFLKLFAGITGFRGESNFDSWLYRLVVNACFDQKRKTRRLMPMVDGFLDLLHAPGGSALDEVLRAEMSAHIRAVVETLPPDQRMVIVLRYTQGLSYEEIAGILGCPAGTIASRLNRVHKVLERRLTRLGGNKRG